jgi:hypothetical protein
LSTIYEQDFLGFSYGFRPGRSPISANLRIVEGAREAARRERLRFRSIER